MNSYKVGIASAVFAQFLWGLFPFYWKLLAHVQPLEVLGHRNLWCALFLGLLVLVSRERRSIVSAVLSSFAELRQHLFSSMLIAGNWLVYIWAVVNDHVIDASLGYFLSPLFSVVLGFLVFGERADRRQWCAIALATLGVLIMVVDSGVLPWIGLTLAATFGVYGMARKKASTGPINGLFIETLLLVPASLLVIVLLSGQSDISFTFTLQSTSVWLVLSGLVTAIPLVLYAQGARALPLSLSGLLVYITPTIQFLVGWLVYQEAISMASWAGFICIWVALFIYSSRLGQTQ